ncbi:MAG: Ribulose-phosphate 3-epimerase [Parcubacteria group bacterium GW2011_GWA1_36_12]|nr:MAG: Ribulose-phosphate 3-epimerase [Parcubacteria group bacterium GW2011_GWA1_36_12]
MAKIIPSILATTEEEFVRLLKMIEPHTDRIHLDIGDGDFVPTKTISGYEQLIKIETKAKFDVHLMVSRPEDQMYFWYKTKADRFLIHAETDHGHKDLISQIHSNNRKVGMVLNPETQVDKIKEVVESLDFVQFMTVHPGFYGSEFVESVIEKILEFHGQYPNVPIMVDGGVNPQTILRLIAIGVTELVVGNYIVSSGDVGKTIEELNKISNNG